MGRIPKFDELNVKDFPPLEAMTECIAVPKISLFRRSFNRYLHEAKVEPIVYHWKDVGRVFDNVLKRIS